MKLFGLLFALFLLVSVPATSLADDFMSTSDKCRKVCTGAGAADVEQCVDFCGEYVVDPSGSIKNLGEGGAPGGWGCYFKLVYYCGQSKEGIALLETLVACVKDGFSSSCLSKRMCDFSKDCLATVCECAGGNETRCKKKMRKTCK